jgi:hypothetical protein
MRPRTIHPLLGGGGGGGADVMIDAVHVSMCQEVSEGRVTSPDVCDPESGHVCQG